MSDDAGDMSETPSRTMRRAAEEVRGWPESYAEPLAAWLEIAAAESFSAYYSGSRVHPALPVANEVLADSRRAATMTERINRARR